MYFGTSNKQKFYGSVCICVSHVSSFILSFSDSTGNVIDLVKDPLPEMQLSEEDRQKNLELLEEAKKVSDRFLTRRGRRSTSSLTDSPTGSAHTQTYTNIETKTLHIDLWVWSWCLSVSFKLKMFIASIFISQPPYLRSFSDSNAIILTMFIEKQLTYCGPSDRCVLSVSCLGSLDLLTINYTPYF